MDQSTNGQIQTSIMNELGSCVSEIVGGADDCGHFQCGKLTSDEACRYWRSGDGPSCVCLKRHIDTLDAIQRAVDAATSSLKQAANGK